jgi:endoglucanase
LDDSKQHLPKKLSMKKNKLIIVLLLLLLSWQGDLFGQSTIVGKYGQLSVKGNYIMSQYGDTVQLRGMSLFWSQWMGQYYNAECIKWLRDDWKCTVVRAAMGVDMGGYGENPEREKAKVIAVVDACIDLGIYVIIDYHSHEAHKNPEQAQRFFSEMAQLYGKYPNVIYEPYNEPLKDNLSWSKDLKPYHEGVIKAIREFDSDNIVVAGTRQWSQLVNEASMDKLSDKNTAYTLHFYAASHRKSLMDEARKAMANGICIMVTEYGSCDASGNGKFDPPHTKEWFDFMDQYKISYANWSVADKEETASIVKPGAAATGGWTEDQLTESGKLIKADLVLKNTPIFESIKKPVKVEKPKPKKEKKKK